MPLRRISVAALGFALGATLAWASPPRPLSHRELWGAVKAALSRVGDSAALAALQSTALSAPVSVSVAAPQLRVLAIRRDPLQGVTRFRMIAAGEPKLLPFDVTLPKLIPLPRADASWVRVTAHATRPAGLAPAVKRPSWVVRPSRPALLVIADQRFRVTLVVRPLELGAVGQKIRVRDLAGKRVLRAQVVGPDRLEIAD